MADHIFICYAHKDDTFVLALTDKLKERGVSVWIDQRDIPAASDWDLTIEHAIRECAHFLIVLSSASVNSGEVRGELRMALDEGKHVCPVLFEATDIPRQLRTIQYTDFTHGDAANADSLTRLLRALAIEDNSKLAAADATAALIGAAPPDVSKSTARKVAPRVLWAVGAVVVVGLILAGIGYQRWETGRENESEGIVAELTPAPSQAAAVLPTDSPGDEEKASPAPGAADLSGANPTAADVPTPGPTPTEPAAGSLWANLKEGAEYTYVPAGGFTMGSAEGLDHELPVHEVYLDGYFMKRTEVTNGEFARCIEAGACTEPSNQRWKDPTLNDHPVTDVDWVQARAYAAWAGGRLPTEAEWEKACQGEDGGTYTWGNEAASPDRMNYDESGLKTTSEVGHYPDGAYGLYDMMGNVWEWTSSKFRPYPYAPDDGREGLGGEERRTLRGGSFEYYASGMRCASRVKNPPSRRMDGSGFRIVATDLSVVPSPMSTSATATPDLATTRQISVELGKVNEEHGLIQVDQTDGLTVPTEIGDKEVRVIDNEPAGGSFIYFRVNPAFVSAEETSVRVYVEYFDFGDFDFEIEYDSTDTSAGLEGRYKRSSLKLTSKNSGQWKTGIFDLPDAYFGERQNGETDFRIAPFGDSDLYINSVIVSKN